ncbi:MAG: hypothetical protein V3W18_03435, partial [candidate division Zixibacteria bacterium]
MEKIRILSAACWLIILLVPAIAQDIIPDSLKRDEIVLPDSLDIIESDQPADSTERDRKSRIDPIDKKRTARDTTEVFDLEEDSTAAIYEQKESIYDKKLYLSRGVGDELKPYTRLLILTHGTVGTPRVPTEYLNVAGMDIRLNGLPFAYNGLYRPYIIGSDLNVIPWEILNDIFVNNGFIDLSLGRPIANSSGSDIEVSRGSYGYNSSR